LIFACKGFSNGGNLSPAGGGIRVTCNIAETGVETTDCFCCRSERCRRQAATPITKYAHCGWLCVCVRACVLHMHLSVRTEK